MNKFPIHGNSAGGPSNAPVRYAKLARPRVHEALPRARLFALLDALRSRCQVIWIVSPPGAGKTTLAASYLAHAAPPFSAWYQVDQSDSDPATMFFFLTASLQEVPQPMTWQAPDADDDLQHYARLYFRDYYSRLPGGSIVVLDNVHDLALDQRSELLEIAVGEVPAGITVLALSREAPPARLARLEMSGQLQAIGWDQLRLDADEVRQLAQPGDGADAPNLAWLDVVDGWAAGIVMLRNLRQQGDQTAPLVSGRDAVFRYFAGEILERMPPQWQRLLLLLSCLPGVSADDAEQLTGDPAASRLLIQLYHNRLFVDRRGNDAFTYHFHALFREFLQYEATLRLDATERATLLERAATILDDQGRTDDAARLFLEAGAHAGLCRLLLKRAAFMLSAGRGQTWREWMSWLPADLAEAEPWLLYWHGCSLNHVANLRGRSILQRAEQAFGKAGDLPAQMLAVTAIIDSYDLEWGDFRALPNWIARLSDGLAALPLDTIDAGFDLKLHSRLLLALLIAQPDSPRLAAVAQRATSAMQAVSEPVELLAAGAILLRYFDWADEVDMVQRLVTDLSKVANDTAISPFHRVWWYGRVARWHNKDGNYREAQQVTGAAKSIVANFDLDPLLFQFLEVHHLLGSGELAAARTLLDKIRLTLAPARKIDCANLTFLEASWRALSSDVPGALRNALEAIRISADASLPPTELSRFEAFLANCYVLTGNFASATEWYDKAASHAYGYDVVLVKEARQFAHAYACAQQGDLTQARAILGSTFAVHRQRQATTFFDMFPRLAAELAALALDAQIEVEHVRALVVRQRLTAPARHIANWPWPVALRTLGKFEMALHGVPVTSQGKAQQRPLALIKALLSAGEAGKMQQALASHLWPEVDDAKSALNVTVHRLRKLLGNDAAIIVNAGRITLNQAEVWSDADALSSLCDRIDSLPDAVAPAQVGALTATLLSLYRGPFCDGDDDSWLLSARDRCRNRFLGAVSKLGQRLEAQQDWAAAYQLYMHALQAEPLAEAIYRGLMRCAHAQNDPSAAFSVYRRCRETLSIVLGRKPSPETDNLASTLGLRP